LYTNKTWQKINRGRRADGGRLRTANSPQQASCKVIARERVLKVPLLTLCRTRVMIFVTPTPNLADIEVQRCAHTAKISLEVFGERESGGGGERQLPQASTQEFAGMGARFPEAYVNGSLSSSLSAQPFLLISKEARLSGAVTSDDVVKKRQRKLTGVEPTDNFLGKAQERPLLVSVRHR